MEFDRLSEKKESLIRQCYQDTFDEVKTCYRFNFQNLTWFLKSSQSNIIENIAETDNETPNWIDLI